MTPKEKAKELIAKHFQIVAKAVGHKGIKTVADTHTFAKIEKLSKTLAILTVTEIMWHEKERHSVLDKSYDYYAEVAEEIKLL